jgi:hypothetical protein
MDQVICYFFAAINLLEAEKTTDKFCRKVTFGKREGMSTEHLLQMPYVRTVRSNTTGFATYSTHVRVIV